MQKRNSVRICDLYNLRNVAFTVIESHLLVLFPVFEHDKVGAFWTLFGPAAAVAFVLLHFSGAAVQLAKLASQHSSGAQMFLKLSSRQKFIYRVRTKFCVHLFS
jgi:hypothetical protein